MYPPVNSCDENYLAFHTAPADGHYRLDGMLAHFYTLLWLVLHLLLTTYEIFRWLRLRLHAIRLWSYDFLLSRNVIDRRDLARLTLCRTQLTKLPRHLNIIIGPIHTKDIDEKLISRIFTYALLMGVDCVSLYDTRLPDTGQISISKLPIPKGIHCKSHGEQRVVWTWKGSPDSYMNGIKRQYTFTNGSNANGIGNLNTNGKLRVTENSLEIYQVTNHEGRPLIANVCRELFADRGSVAVAKLLNDRTQLKQRIDDELSKHLQYKCPEPNLSFVFNAHSCSFGLLPWHTRFTEFYTIETGRHFDVNTFTEILYKYSRCEQRWGK